MPTVAYSALEWLEAHPEANSAQKSRLLDEVPPWQWKAPGGHWLELSMYCANRVEPALERRPANALCIEIGTPMPRCLFREPGGPREGRSNLLWLLSGGDVLAYGLCEQSECFWCNRK